MSSMVGAPNAESVTRGCMPGSKGKLISLNTILQIKGIQQSFEGQRVHHFPQRRLH